LGGAICPTWNVASRTTCLTRPCRKWCRRKLPWNRQSKSRTARLKTPQTESCPTATATELNSDKRQTRSSATSILCPGLVQHSNGETKPVSDDKAKKFKFPRVAMKFCSNQRIKFNRKKDKEVIVNVPIPEEANPLPATDIPPHPVQASNGESGGTVLDRFIPVPESFSGLNNPFRLRDDKIREARKLICTRRLGLEDLTKVNIRP